MKSLLIFFFIYVSFAEGIKEIDDLINLRLYDNALDKVLLLEKKSPEIGKDLLLRKARILAFSNKFKELDIFLSKVKEIDDGGELLFWNALAKLNIGKEDKAEELLENYIDLDKRGEYYYEAKISLIKILYLEEDYDGAILLCKNLLGEEKKFPKDLFAIFLLKYADLLIKGGSGKDYDTAIEVLSHGVLDKEKKTKGIKSFFIAHAFYKKNDFSKSEEILEQAIGNNGFGGILKISLAQVCFAQGKNKKAVSLLIEVLNLPKKDSKIYRLAYRTLLDLDIFSSENSREYIQLLEDSENPDILASIDIFRAKLDLENDDIDSAIMRLKKVVENKNIQKERELALELLKESFTRKNSFEQYKLYIDSLLKKSKAGDEHGFFVTAKADLKLSAEKFLEARRLISKKDTYNYVVSSIWSGEKVINNVTSLSEEEKKSVSIEQAIKLAKDKDYQSAKKLLTNFVIYNKGHYRIGEAYLTLAEIFFYEKNYKLARENLDKAEDNLSERSEIIQGKKLRIWLYEAEGLSDKAVAECKDFIDKYDNYINIEEIRLKYGEILYRVGNYAESELVFSNLSVSAVNTEIKQIAMIFAGKSAFAMHNETSFNKALSIWDNLANNYDSDIAFEARKLQAMALSKNGELKKAIKIYDKLLDNYKKKNISPNNILIIRGQTFFSLAKSNLKTKDDYEYLRKAIADFDRIDSLDNDDAFYLKAEARYRKGRAFEKMKSMDRAQKEYSSAYSMIAKLNNSDEHISFALKWIFRAGFKLISMKEKNGFWSDALAIANRLAGLNWERSPEAKEYADKLRLKYFIWEGGNLINN